MRILVDSGDYRCSNMGDAAMLSLLVRRIGKLAPGSSIDVLTGNPEFIGSVSAPAVGVPQKGRQIWFSDRYLLGTIHNLLPRAISNGVVHGKRALRVALPALFRTATRWKASRGVDRAPLEQFLDAFDRADLVAICGQGAFYDRFWSHTLSVLELLEMAIHAGKPTVMFGQGMGPMDDPELVERARKILSRVDLILLREPTAAVALLARLGVRPERIALTGDDAVELAYDLRPVSLGSGVGINVRFEHSTGTERSHVEALRRGLRRFVSRQGTRLIPLPISRYPDLRDVRDIRSLTDGMDAENFDGNDGRDLDTPEKVIRQAGRCRIVVTTAYHAAVFALSQGIPAVCLIGSDYYRLKFEGLRHLFGAGCELVNITEETESDLVSVIERVWSSAEQLRPSLLDAAARQIALNQNGYRAALRVPLGRRNSNQSHTPERSPEPVRMGS